MRVIGTAGHVDHGKSTLIAALTGTHPDRLKEEQAREMTIDLGFGWLTLPNGEEVGIVDVPGHRDFIENMLAGIGGIDAAMLVVAADEGVMPQTREHLAILDLLQIPAGIIVLSKIDLSPDVAWLDLLEADLRASVAGTVLHDAPCVRVSARTNHGLDTLLNTLGDVLTQKPARPDIGRPRLPVDRVFTMAGFGTVVTGTLTDGHLALGDELEILPFGTRGRVRGLQTHKKKEVRAVPGSRTAVNISGVETDQVTRGHVIAHPGQYQPSRRLDARFRLLSDASATLKHGTLAKFFVGASETIALVRLLGTDELLPGEEGLIQLELREPVVAVRGDRYILRRPSPAETLGGGQVVDQQPKGRHKRFSKEVLRSLGSLAAGSPSDVLLEAAMALNAAPLREIVARSRLQSEDAAAALAALIDSGQLRALDDGPIELESDMLIIAAAHWKELETRARRIVAAYHEEFPLRRGIPREEFKSRLHLSPRLFASALRKLIAEQALISSDKSIALPGFEVKLDTAQQASVQKLVRRFSERPYSPPTVKESRSEVGDEIFDALMESHELVAVSGDIIFRPEDYDAAVSKIRQVLQDRGTITLAEVRDLLDTSRKYVQPLLEHLDSIGFTVREGDFRKLRG